MFMHTYHQRFKLYTSKLCLFFPSSNSVSTVTRLGAMAGNEFCDGYHRTTSLGRIEGFFVPLRHALTLLRLLQSFLFQKWDEWSEEIALNVIDQAGSLKHLNRLVIHLHLRP